MPTAIGNKVIGYIIKCREMFVQKIFDLSFIHNATMTKRTLKVSVLSHRDASTRPFMPHIGPMSATILLTGIACFSWLNMMFPVISEFKISDPLFDYVIRVFFIIS